MSRTIGKEISPSRSASCGHGPTLIIWCTAGVSGMLTPGHVADLGAPHAAGDDDVLGLDVAAGRCAPAGSGAVLDVEAGDLDVGDDGERAGLQRPLAHDRAGAQRVDDADARRPEGADDLVVLEEGHLLLRRTPGVTSSASMPQAFALRHPPAQLLHPLLGAGDLEAAGLGEDAHLLVLPHRVEREVGDLPGVVDGEDEVRRVTGRAARVGQRPLVDLDDVAPAEPGQVVDQAVADDAGADDDAACGGGDLCQQAHLLLRIAQSSAPYGTVEV